MEEVKVSFLIPCFNESGNIDKIYEKIANDFSGEAIQLVFVDDGSKDNTIAEIKELSRKHDNISFVSFSRNFGKEAAMLSGLKKCKGTYTALIDADLQQDPLFVKQMVQILDSNPEVDVVCAKPARRKESALKKFLKEGFYKIDNWISEVPMEQDASDFRTFRNNVKEALLSLPEYGRFSKGLFSFVGFKTQYIEYEVKEREIGVSKWSLTKLFRYAFNGIFSFSNFPLVFILYLGIVFLGAMEIVFLVSLFTHTFETCRLAMTLLFLVGVTLCMLGVVSLYLAKIYSQVKGRPIYIVKEESKDEH